MPEICPRCKQPFVDIRRLQTHLKRKKPCRDISKPIDEFIEKASLEKIEKQPEPERVEEKIEKIMNPLSPSFDTTVQHGVELQLDPNTGNSTVLFGSSKAGKSTLLMYLYRKYYQNAISILFSENPQIKLYKDPKLIRSTYFLPSVIGDFHRINRRTKNHYDFTVLMDDIVDEKENNTVRKLILTFRNSNISSIVSLQSPTLLNKSNRASVNNIIFFRFNTDEMIEQVIRTYLSSYLKGRMDDKIRQYRELTKDHQFIYLDPRENKISVHKISI